MGRSCEAAAWWTPPPARSMPASRPNSRRYSTGSWRSVEPRLTSSAVQVKEAAMMQANRINLTRYMPGIAATRQIRFHGKVTHVVGLVIEGYCPDTAVASLCEIHTHGGDRIQAEVVGFRENKALLMPLGELRGVGLGSLISVRRQKSSLGVGRNLLGRVID